MSGYVILDRFLPILVVRRIGPMGAESMASMRDAVNAKMRATSEKIVLVYDSPPGTPGSPDAGARRVVAGWWKDDAELLARRCASIEFSLPSAMSRGVLTAILWLAVPPIPTTLHADVRAAIDGAIARVGARADARDVVRALDALGAPSR